MIIAVDFDGTCVTNEFPKVGNNIGAVPVLRELTKLGHKLILWTMRGNTTESFDGTQSQETYLQQALNWANSNEVKFWGVNENPEQTKDQWTDSNQHTAYLIIDDYNLGCPLRSDPKGNLFVDWLAIVELLNKQGFFTYEQVKKLNSQVCEELKAFMITSRIDCRN